MAEQRRPQELGRWELRAMLWDGGVGGSPKLCHGAGVGDVSLPPHGPGVC